MATAAGVVFLPSVVMVPHGYTRFSVGRVLFPLSELWVVSVLVPISSFLALTVN